MILDTLLLHCLQLYVQITVVVVAVVVFYWEELTSTVSIYSKFVGYNLKDSRRRHVCNC